MKEKIISYYEKKHKEEATNNNCKLPQTMRAKQIRAILKLIEAIN